MHLVRPQVFAAIMPRAIPEEHHTNLIYVSGVVELVCAAGLVRRTRWAAAASLATLAAVFPANVQMALDAGTGRNAGPTDSRAVAWGRLPLQLVLAWACSRLPPGADDRGSPRWESTAGTSRFSPQKQANGLSLYGGTSTYPAAR